jgi:hypothetical protein
MEETYSWKDMTKAPLIEGGALYVSLTRIGVQSNLRLSSHDRNSSDLHSHSETK